MEKILVAIDGRHGAWEALSHACSLARRIHVQLNVLLVIPLDKAGLSHAAAEVEEHIKKRLELLIEAAKAEGIVINYFITEGNYDDEVISFVNHNKITLLVHETHEGETRPASREMAETLRSLRHRIACTMEIVAPKKTYT
jgi:nucleotide-binding universal stress UspA family protein